MYVQREVISSMVKRIQREVTLSITQRHDFVRIIHSIIKTRQCLTIVVLSRFRPFYNTFYNGDIYQDNARQNTVRLFIKFNLNVNYKFYNT